MGTLNEYEIHELILEDIEDNSPDETPDIVKYLPGVSEEIPEGMYAFDEAVGIWRRVS